MGLDSLSQPDIIQNCLHYFEQEIDIKNFSPAIFKQISNSKMKARINKSNLFWYIFADNHLILKARIKRFLSENFSK
jgi:hypothetical protein